MQKVGNFAGYPSHSLTILHIYIYCLFMKIENENQTKSQKNNWKSYWPLGVVVVLVIIGWYLAAGSSLFDSQAAPPQARSSSASSATSVASRPVQVASPARLWQPRSNDPTIGVDATVTESSRNAGLLGREELQGQTNYKFGLMTAYRSGHNILDYVVYAPASYTVEQVRYKFAEGFETPSTVHPPACGTPFTDRMTTTQVAKPQTLPASSRTKLISGRTFATDVEPKFFSSINLSTANVSYAEDYPCFHVTIRQGDTTIERYLMPDNPVLLWATDNVSVSSPLPSVKGTVIATDAFTEPDLSPASKIDLSITERNRWKQVQVWGTSNNQSYASYRFSFRGMLQLDDAQLDPAGHSVAYFKLKSNQTARCRLANFSYSNHQDDVQRIYAPTGADFFAEPLLANERYCLQLEQEYEYPGRGGQDRTVSKIFLLRPTNLIRIPHDNATERRLNAVAERNYNVNLPLRRGAPTPTVAEKALHASNRDHVRATLQIGEVQTTKGLHFRLYTPHGKFSDEPNPDYEIDYGIENVSYGKVNSVADCTFSKFSRIEDKTITAADSEIGEVSHDFKYDAVHTIAVHSADRGSRYCFKVKLRIVIEDRGGADRLFVYEPEYLFVMDRGLAITAGR